MFEHHQKPLLPRADYIKRLALNFGVALFIIAIALGFGILGYHHYGKLEWIDSFLNASMILTGMGPVNILSTPEGKIFAGCYALFSGIVFLSSIVVILAPMVHRFLHRFHLQDENNS